MPQPTKMMTAGAEASSQAILAGGKPPPEYQVMKDGTLIIGGDVLVSCGDLLNFDKQEGDITPKVRRQLRQARKEQIAVCTKAGFPPDKTPQSSLKDHQPRDKG